ncbi:signal transducer and transcription activator-like isoform X1 [Drosophila tropicalis]|uniref:signal transducer and transcription activator-like isoform X1 n=1 Tax=Drosophila tropicalis TaxID=46794 RepID=UPI0035AC1D11
MEQISSYITAIHNLFLKCINLQIHCDRAFVEKNIHSIYKEYCALEAFCEHFKNCVGPNAQNFSPLQCQIYQLLSQFFNSLLGWTYQLTIKKLNIQIKQDILKLMKLVCHVDVPTQVLTKGNCFNATFRCLYMDDWSPPPRVCCHILSGDEIKTLQDTLDPSQIVENASVYLENSTETLEYKDEKRLATFDKMKLIETKRLPNTKAVLEDKHALLFCTEIVINTERVYIWSISDPVVQITNGNQQRIAEGTIFWMTYFPMKTLDPFTVYDWVSCQDLTRALEKEFRKRIPHRPLCYVNIAYIYKIIRAFAKQDWISSKMFFKTFWQSDHSFWEWFYNLMKFLQPEKSNRNTGTSVQAIWQAGYIAGFISNEKAAELLKDQRVGTFIIRFSESNINALNVVQKMSDTSVQVYKPWNKEEVNYVSLATCIDHLSGADFVFSIFDNKSKDRNEIIKPPTSDRLNTTNYPRTIGIQSSSSTDFNINVDIVFKMDMDFDIDPDIDTDLQDLLNSLPDISNSDEHLVRELNHNYVFCE